MDSLPLECPECGERFPRDSRFCPHDGEVLLEMGAKTLLFDGVDETERAAPSFIPRATTPDPISKAPPPEKFDDQTPHDESFEDEFTKEDSKAAAPRVPSRVPSFLPPPPHAKKAEKDPLLGSVVGSYKIEALLGQGGMGRIYRAVHMDLGKLVAVKVLRADVAGDGEANARFIREARSTSALGHPNIVDVSDFGALEDGRSYFVMELLEGASLHQVIQQLGRLEPLRALRMVERLASALQAAHARGIVHRDLKPGNVFVCGNIERSPEVKLLDFGIAKVTDATVRLTVAGAIFGTPQYMAPEQCIGSEVDHRADIYALGIMLFEMLTGQPPFDDPIPVEILFMQRSSPIPNLPPHLARLQPLMHKVLAKEPAERFQSMRDFGVAIEDASDVLAGPPPSFSPPPQQPGSPSAPPSFVPPAMQSPAMQSPPMPQPGSLAPAAVPSFSPDSQPPALESIDSDPQQKRTLAFSYDGPTSPSVAPAPYSNPPPPHSNAPLSNAPQSNAPQSNPPHSNPPHSNPPPPAAPAAPALAAPPAPVPKLGLSRGRILLLILGGLAVIATGAGLAITLAAPAVDDTPTAVPLAATLVTLSSQPAGAQVYLGDVLVGVTPLQIPLPESTQQYRLTLPGHAEQTLTLGPSSPPVQSVTMTASP